MIKKVKIIHGEYDGSNLRDGEWVDENSKVCSYQMIDATKSIVKSEYSNNKNV